MMKSLSILGLAFMLFGCSAEGSERPTADRIVADPCTNDMTEPVTVSIAAVIANPSKFEGKSIAVIGFLHQSFEHSAIYLHREDFLQSIAQNGIWVDGSGIPETLNDRYVRLEGIFTTMRKGHFSMWPGTLCNVERSVAWPAWALTIRSSRTCFAAPNTWQKELAMCLAPLRKSA